MCSSLKKTVIPTHFEIFQVRTENHNKLPFFISSISAGCPSPAEDYIEQNLDLNDLMIKHPAATFFVRVQGDSMQGASIYSGDILVVDRSLDPTNGKIVVAVLNGEFTVKRILIKDQIIILLPENASYSPIKISPHTQFEVWGVVSYIIHKAG